MRKHGRTDSNQSDIVKALRKAGATVQSLADVGGGCPDLLVGYFGYCILFEVKDGTLVLSKPRPRVREGWAAAAQTIGAAVDDKQVLGEHALVDEEDWQW